MKIKGQPSEGCPLILQVLLGLLPQSGHHHGLYGVEAVLSLIEHYRGRRFKDLLGYLQSLAAEFLVDVLAYCSLSIVEGW